MTNYSGVSVPCLRSPAFCFSAEISQHLHLQHLGPPVNSETDTIIAVYTHTHTHIASRQFYRIQSVFILKQDQ